MPEVRRFPPPWDIEEANASCFIVKDNNGQASPTCISRVIPAGARLPIYSPATKLGASPPISPSCRRCCATNANNARARLAGGKSEARYVA